MLCVVSLYQEEEEGDGKEGEGFHICTLNVKQPVLEGKSVMKSEKAKREEEEKEEEEEERKKNKRMEEEEKVLNPHLPPL